jgi:RNA polymerase sigma-70 factor (ECF subfamily)
MDRFDPTRPVKPWLFGITFRIVSDYRRRGSFKREIPVAEMDEAASQGDPSTHLEASRRRQLVMKALEFLSNDERAILVMVELQGHSVVEAARVLEANENTLYSRLRSARKTLTAALRKLGAVGETP